MSAAAHRATLPADSRADSPRVVEPRVLRSSSSTACACRGLRVSTLTLSAACTPARLPPTHADAQRLGGPHGHLRQVDGPGQLGAGGGRHWRCGRRNHVGARISLESQAQGRPAPPGEVGRAGPCWACIFLSLATGHVESMLSCCRGHAAQAGRAAVQRQCSARALSPSCILPACA